MSTQHPTDVPDDPNRVFPELIRDEENNTQNARVCQNCFSRLFREEPFDQDTGLEHGEVLADVSWTIPTDHKHPLLDREYWETVQINTRLGVDHHDSTRTYCRECGHFDYHKAPNRRSTADLINDIDVLARTLREYGVKLDTDVLRRETKRLKSEIGGEAGDGEILRRSVAAAIQSKS